VADPDKVPNDGASARRKVLVIDEIGGTLERFRFLRASDSHATDDLLEDLGAESQAERDIVYQLSVTQPLTHPERFLESHVLAMRSLEVLGRNGARGVDVPARLGPLRPLAGFLVHLGCRFLVRQHERTVVEAISTLYAQRLAWTKVDDDGRPVLLQAHDDVERAKETFRGNPIGLPAFLIGGAAISTVGSLLRAAGDAALGSAVAASVALFLVTVALGGLAWAALRAAAIARRRIRLTIETPIDALWETVGRAGSPPKDQARQLAIWAIVATAVAWLVVPAGILYVVSAF
jgi:hypothetical protein